MNFAIENRAAHCQIWAVRILYLQSQVDMFSLSFAAAGGDCRTCSSHYGKPKSFLDFLGLLPGARAAMKSTANPLICRDSRRRRRRRWKAGTVKQQAASLVLVEAHAVQQHQVPPLAGGGLCARTIPAVSRAARGLELTAVTSDRH